MIEKRLGHKIETINETELVTLRKIAKTLDDNAGKADDFFDFSAVGKSSPSKPEHTVETPASKAFNEGDKGEPAETDDQIPTSSRRISLPTNRLMLLPPKASRPSSGSLTWPRVTA